MFIQLHGNLGVKDTNKVFHSFRHGFQEALRRTTPDEELRDALAGRSSGKSVSRSYGAKAMLVRWGVGAKTTGGRSLALTTVGQGRLFTLMREKPE
jgi:hypothetical protein